MVRIKSENKHNLNILFERLREITIIEPDNRISYHAFEKIDLEWFFLSIIDFGRLLSIESRKQILKRAFDQLAIKGNYEKKYFVDKLNEQLKLHLSQKEKTFYLLTSLSIKKLPFRKINFANCQIYIHGKYFPEKFKKHRKNSLIKHGVKTENKNYTKVSVQIKSNDFKDAYEESFQYLENFRAMLCLFLNSQMEIRFGNYYQNPINKIQYGEIISLHNDDGTNAYKDSFWFIADFKEIKSLELKNDNKAKLKSDIKWSIKKFNNCKIKHQQLLTKALNLYVSAFDESNKYICFLKGWTVLETLMNTDQNDILIKRCLAMLRPESKPLEKQILESLRQYRNEYVHKGGDGLDPLNACYHIQRFIYNMIVKFNFNFSGLFNNIEEAIYFIDNYSPTIKELESRRKIIIETLQLKQKIRNANTR